MQHFRATSTGVATRFRVPATLTLLLAAMLLLTTASAQTTSAQTLQPEELDAAVSQLSSAQAAERARGAQRLLAAADHQAVLTRLTAVLADDGATLRQQVEAVRVLGRMGRPGAIAALISVVGDEGRGALRSAAVMALARYEDKEASQAIAGLLPAAASDPQLLAATLFAVEKREIVEALPVLTQWATQWSESADTAVIAIQTGRALLATAAQREESAEDAAAFVEALREVIAEEGAPASVAYAAGFALGAQQHPAAVRTLIRVIVEGLEAPPEPPQDEDTDQDNGEAENNETDADADADETYADIDFDTRNHLLAQRAARLLGSYPIVGGDIDVYPHVLSGVVINPSTRTFTDRQLEAFNRFAVTAGADVLPRLIGSLEYNPQPLEERQVRVARQAIRALLDDSPEALEILEAGVLEPDKLLVLLEILEDFVGRQSIDFVTPILDPRGPDAVEFSPAVRVAALKMLQRCVERYHEAQAALGRRGSDAEGLAATARRDAAWAILEPRDASVDNPSVVQLVIEQLDEEEGAVTDDQGNVIADVRRAALDVLTAFEDAIDRSALVRGGALSRALERRLLTERDPVVLAQAADVYVRATPAAQAASHMVGLLNRVHDPVSRQNLYTAIQRLSPNVAEVHQIITAASRDLDLSDTSIDLDTRIHAAEVLRWSQTRDGIETLGQVLSNSEAPMSLRHRIAEELVGLQDLISEYPEVVKSIITALYRDYRAAADVDRELIGEPLREMLGTVRNLPASHALEALRPFLAPRTDRLDVLALRELRFIIRDREVANEIVPELLRHIGEMEGHVDLDSVVRALERTWGLPARRIIERLQPHLGGASYMREGISIIGDANLDARMQARVTRAMIALAREADEGIAREAVRLVGQMRDYPGGASLLRSVYVDRPELRDEIVTAAQRLSPGWRAPEVD